MDHSLADQVRPVGEGQVNDLFLDDALEEPAPRPYRLAGVGAALGSCFSVMIVLLAVGAAGTIAGPRSSLAGEAMSPQSPVVASPRNDQPRFSEEDVQRLQALDRMAITARAQVQAVESKLALIRSRTRLSALQHATQARAQADQLELRGSPYDWMSTERAATRTRQLAQTKLATDLALLQSLQDSLATELAQLRDVSDRAERSLIAARLRVMVNPVGDAPGSGFVRNSEPAPQPAAPTPCGNAEDLLGLIARHRASLDSADRAIPRPD